MSVANGTGGGKRGKKRARGAEDSLVGGLEGREAQAVTHETVKAIIASLQCKLDDALLADDSGIDASYDALALAIAFDILHQTPLVTTFASRFHVKDYI